MHFFSFSTKSSWELNEKEIVTCELWEYANLTYFINFRWVGNRFGNFSQIKKSRQDKATHDKQVCCLSFRMKLLGLLAWFWISEKKLVTFKIAFLYNIYDMITLNNKNLKQSTFVRQETWETRLNSMFLHFFLSNTHLRGNSNVQTLWANK